MATPTSTTSSGPSARVRWDIRDGASVFNNDACYLHPAPKEDFGFDSIGVDDVDDGCVRPSRDEAPSSSISSPPVNHLPWEVRFAVCVSRPGSIYGTTERVLGEGVLNLAEFTDSVHGKRVSEKRVEVRLALGGNGGNDGGNDPSSAASSARLSVSVSVTRAPGLASKAAARLGDKGLRAKDRAVAGKLFSYLSGSPSGANKSTTTNRSSGDSLPARSSEDSNESDRRLQRRDGHVRERLHAVASDDPDARSHRGANRRFWFNRGPGFFSRNRFARLQRQSKASLEVVELEHEVDVPGTQAAAGRCR